LRAKGPRGGGVPSRKPVGPVLEALVSCYAGGRIRRALREADPRCGPIGDPPEGEPLQLYLHVPFCERPCAFCAFHRVRFQEELASRYYSALCAEMRGYYDRGWRFDTLYVGGGTPTVLPRALAELIGLARRLWDLRSVSVETHPGHLGDQVIGLLAAQGVQRLSVGVQSFQPEVLRALGREPEPVRDQQAWGRIAEAAGSFATLNVDMMFGVPGQDADLLARDIDAILRLRPQQVTFYPLMRSRRAEREKPVALGRQYRQIVDALSGVYGRSSAWCFSRAGPATIDEYIAEDRDYAGLGSGAFGYVRGVLCATTFSVAGYIGRVCAGESPVVACRLFPPEEQARYDMLMRLSTDPLGRVRGSALPAREMLLLAAAGGLRPTMRGPLLSERGRFIAMLAMKEFFSAVGEFRATCRELSQRAESFEQEVALC
jgi:coproporphyrinogen III oxidase-like Fe-S oxidoreductase